MFDARFIGDEDGSLFAAGGGTIALHGARSPLAVTWDIAEPAAVYQLSAGASAHRLERTGSVLLTAPEIRQLHLATVTAGELPAEFALGRNYPNPFNPTTTIPLALPVQSRVTIEVFNILGQRVRTLLNTDLPAGNHTVVWDGLGDGGTLLGSGVQFIRMRAVAGDGTLHMFTNRALLVK
jgi:hypothetical protein